MINYEWRMPSDQPVGPDNLLAMIAASRDEDLGRFTRFVETTKGVRNPNELPNVAAACARLRRAIADGERIVVCGDYDVDGVTATAVMVLGLTAVGARVHWLVPDRVVDGYGLSKRMVDVCREDRADLLVTVDNGVTAFDNIAYAKSLGMDVVVTDHHPVRGGRVPTEITVDPFVDPLYPFPGICGCMVAYKLLRVLIPDLSSRPLNSELIALTTLATVADAMDLVDENRVFVLNGLKLLNHTGNHGLNQLLEQLRLMNRAVTSTDIGFTIAPCLNAAGRMGDAGECVRLFLGDDDVEAGRVAAKLVAVNERRKALQRTALASVEVNDDPVIFQEFPDAPGGMLGIIAGQIASKYQRPCFAVRNVNGRLGGSGRSVGGFDIAACVVNNRDIAGGGGHAGACGVFVDAANADEFRRRCAAEWAKFVEAGGGADAGTPVLDIVGRLPLSLATLDFVSLVDRVGPFGKGNPMPLFATCGARLVNPEVIGKLSNTVRGQLVDAAGGSMDFVCFNSVKDKLVDDLGTPGRVDAAFSIGVNEWAGRRTVQAILEDVRTCS